jgi:hypothetical protein
MQKWEYNVDRLYNNQSMSSQQKKEILDTVGSDGWELVSCIKNEKIDAVEYIFKRPLKGIGPA